MDGQQIVLLVALACILTACGGEGGAVTDEPGTSGAGDDVLFERPTRQAPDWYEDNRRRWDPAEDGWRSEVLHDLAKATLRDFLDEVLLGPHGDAPVRLEAFLSEDFSDTSALVPASLEVIFDDGATVVRRGTVATERFPRAEVERVVEELRLSFEGAEHLHPSFKIVRVTILEDRIFETVALLHIAGDKDGGGIQQNSRLRVGWEALGDDEELRIRSLDVESFEEIRVARTLLGDLTLHVFGDNPFFREEYLRGVPEYFHRTDFYMVGSSMPGMQGIAVGDLDGDGRDDIYVPQQGGLPNRLFLNRPDGTAVDATKRSGLGFLDGTRSALICDVDGDGDQDVAIGLGPVTLVAFNDGTARFTAFEPLRAPGLEEVYSLAAADPDNDGDLDIFACRYSSRDNLSGSPVPFHEAKNGAPNVYWRNEGDGKFVDATADVGFAERNFKFSYAAIWEDFDDDGDMDLYVANDFGLNNLFRNEDGYFRDVAKEVGAADQSAGMGASVADYDLDGDMDLYVTNMFSSAGSRITRQDELYREELQATHARFSRGNTLLSNRGDGTFEDVTEEAGVAVGGWAWGAKFVDFNNDGLEDLYSPNGYITNDDPEDT